MTGDEVYEYIVAEATRIRVETGDDLPISVPLTAPQWRAFVSLAHDAIVEADATYEGPDSITELWIEVEGLPPVIVSPVAKGAN